MKRKFVIISIVLVILVIVLVFIILVERSRIKKFLDLKVADKISRAIGRKTTIGNISYSFLEGILIKNLCIKEKDGITNFFCAENTIIGIEKLSALKGKLAFSNVAFLKGKILLKKGKDKWNFDDLLPLLPQNNKPIHLNWNARNFAFENFQISIIFEKDRNELVLEDSKLKVKHQSRIGGNFEIYINSILNAYFREKFISGEINSNYNLNFDYSKLDSINGKTRIEKITCGDITAQRLTIETKIFGISGSKRQRKFELKSELSQVLIPRCSEIYESIREKASMIEKLFGKIIYPQNELYIKNLIFLSDFRNEEAQNTLGINSNFISFLLESKLNIKNSKHFIRVKFQNQDKEILIKSDSDISNPKPQPAISETINSYLKSGIMKIEKVIINQIEEKIPGMEEK